MEGQGKGKEDNEQPCTQTLTQASCSVPNTEGRQGLTMTNGDGYCSKLQEKPIKGKACSFFLSLYGSLMQGRMFDFSLN